MKKKMKKEKKKQKQIRKKLRMANNAHVLWEPGEPMPQVPKFYL